RFSRDWSSDVCSSDLECFGGTHSSKGGQCAAVERRSWRKLIAARMASDKIARMEQAFQASFLIKFPPLLDDDVRAKFEPIPVVRSEERRVGKGCRHGW